MSNRQALRFSSPNRIAQTPVVQSAMSRQVRRLVLNWQCLAACRSHRERLAVLAVICRRPSRSENGVQL